jgi:membrane-anchored protein YejM (alkaline phosphatase superfamily)
VALPSPLSPPQTEGEKKRILEEITLTPTARPNIYLFVIESLRKDVITPEIAPALALFRRQNIDCEMSLSNGNATHLSWFSLFHSNYPFYWSAVQKSGWSSGSPALQLLSKMGYKMRVYSSANLGYYGMDELIFGKNHHLASSFQTYPHMRPKPTWKSDVETIDAFEQDSLDPDLQSGQCFVFFWDATHFDYSWPKESPPRFFPFASELNYFKAYQSQENIASIKNRYKNAVHFIDTLFARFLTLAPKDSIIVVAGDHGEEFFEQGRLFHLSALNNVQTEVPLFCQLPRKPATIPKLMTQMDLFPTIIDAITTDGATSGLLEGESLFLKERWPYAVLARYNASRSPCEFCLHNGRHKIIARFENTKDIFRSRSFKVLSLRTHCDRIFCECKRDPQGWIQSEFAGAIERLFQAEVKN